MKTKNIIFALALSTLVFTGCKKDKENPENPSPSTNDSEIITTCSITFVDPTGTQPSYTATFRDPDGDGSSAPTAFDTIFLHPSTLYNASILLLNETISPADTISNEVLEEGDEHLFCFEIADADVVVTRTDSDGTYEIGLLSNWLVGSAGSGNVTVTLKHQPGVKNGNCDPGDTDVEITFPIVVE